MEQTVAQDDVRLNGIQSKLSDIELTSYDGSLLWKITDFSRRRQEAICGDAIKIHSPPFYTSRIGQLSFTLPPHPSLGGALWL